MNQQLPHIVFIVLDTHRADRLSCYGYHQQTSPNLDAFARHATLYQQAIAPAQWTIPSHASMFSGEYPSTHLTIQASDALAPAFPTLAETLSQRGYLATGFCNNPLVGVLDNGLRRGFSAFYNYGGAIPSPYIAKQAGLGQHIKHSYHNLLARIANPIYQSIAASAEVFRFVLNPRLVSLWTRYANFKGHTARSLQDSLDFLQNHTGTGKSEPHFLFINLMETHLPYTPPEDFITRFAPRVQQDPQARRFIELYNTRAFHWLLPLEENLLEMEAEVLSGMYDAEVAYQDHLLHALLNELEQDYHREQTVVVIVGDHGEMHGEHRVMGHALGVYQELVHVPLLIRFPGQTTAESIATPVSTRQIFQTLLVETGDHESPAGLPQSANQQTNEAVLSEAFPPDNMILTMEKLTPHLIEVFHGRANHKALLQANWKLLQVAGIHNQLFNLQSDSQEANNLGGIEITRRDQMLAELEQAVELARQRRPAGLQRAEVDLSDERLARRLRGLGYLD
ncbi:MAG: sulfatase-like hydrolase/transferase [Anaerolineales bacterium]|nr:sulfatase-like hydrolase/transferase [Anaerolineales bacterium]